MELEECHLEIAWLRASLERDRLGDRSNNQLHDASAWTQHHSPKHQTRSSSAESMRRTAPAHEPSQKRTDRKQLAVHEMVAPGVQILKPTTQRPKKESFVAKTRRRALEAEYFKQVRLAQLEAECELNENLHIRAAREARAHRETELMIQRQKQQADQEKRERLALELNQQIGSAVAVAATETQASRAVAIVKHIRDEKEQAVNASKPDTEPLLVLTTEVNAGGEGKAEVKTEESNDEEPEDIHPSIASAQASSIIDAMESTTEQTVDERRMNEEATSRDVIDYEDAVSAATANSKERQAVDADEVDESMETEHQEKAQPAAKTAIVQYEEDFKDENDETSDSEPHETAEDATRTATAPRYEEDEFKDNNPQLETDTVVVDPYNDAHSSDFAPVKDATEQSGANPEPYDTHSIAINAVDASLHHDEAEHNQGFVVDIELPPVAHVSNSKLLVTTEEAEDHEELNGPQGFAVEPPTGAAQGLSGHEDNDAVESDTVQGFLQPLAGIDIGPIAITMEEKPGEAAEHRPHGFRGMLEHVGEALDQALDVCEQLAETVGESIGQQVTAVGHLMVHSLQHTREAAANSIQRLWRQRQAREPLRDAEANDPAEPLHAEPHEEPFAAEPAQTEQSPSQVDSARTMTTDEYSEFSDEEPETQ